MRRLNLWAWEARRQVISVNYALTSAKRVDKSVQNTPITDIVRNAPKYVSSALKSADEWPHKSPVRIDNYILKEMKNPKPTKPDTDQNIEDELETYDGKAQNKRDLSIKENQKNVNIRKEQTEPLEDQEDVNDKEGDFS